MADNYLEKRYDEVFVKHSTKKHARAVNSIDNLLLKNRSYRGYEKSYVVRREMLERIVSVNTKIPSARNQQALRFKLVTKDTGADLVLANIKLGGALPELKLPHFESQPEAFIIVCSTIQDNKLLNIDIGISVQSMLLKAVEMGLNGIIIGAFNKNEIQKAFNLECEPHIIVAIGKGAEQIKLVPINESDSHNYYREENVHFVPKVKLEDLII